MILLVFNTSFSYIGSMLVKVCGLAIIVLVVAVWSFRTLSLVFRLYRAGDAFVQAFVVLFSLKQITSKYYCLISFWMDKTSNNDDNIDNDNNNNNHDTLNIATYVIEFLL